MAANEEVDVLIIGGGIHGVGVAQAAAANGYSVLVLERRGLAHGTSSRSSKLIHGGLRYLESAEFSLVRESLRERALLLKLAPTLVRPQQFFIPVYPRTSRRPWMLRAGLGLYALLAGMGEQARFRSVPRKEWNDLDGLNTQGLQAVFQYWDAQTDDAQLTRAVMQSAEALGAELRCPATFTSAEILDDHCKVRYEADHGTRICLAKTVVNAGGPWARGLLRGVSPTLPDFPVDNVRGAHLELPGEVTRGCYYMEAMDKRAVFVMPWKDTRTLLGTTESKFQGDPEDVACSEQEREYLLDVYRRHFPNRDTTVLDAWAGLRVLPTAAGAAFKRSRETQLPVDNESRPRLLSIFGGKLTGYRATAEKVMGILKRTLPARTPKADTKNLELKL